MGISEGNGVGSEDIDGIEVGSCEGIKVGKDVGFKDGEDVTDGTLEGLGVVEGDEEGNDVEGKEVGVYVGNVDGFIVGDIDGSDDGTLNNMSTSQ